jgi:hypothetical protein
MGPTASIILLSDNWLLFSQLVGELSGKAEISGTKNVNAAAGVIG